MLNNIFKLSYENAPRHEHYDKKVGEFVLMRFINLLIIITIISFCINPQESTANAIHPKQSMIIEVDGDPHEHKQYIEDYHPFVEVVQVYDTIFNGLAIQADRKNIEKLGSLDFVQQTYPVRTYQTMVNDSVPFLLDAETNAPSKYTGKGVKVGVIDTGIDHTHPDLKDNFYGGYDLVDLDEDPMETTKSEGMPTIHGTHVSGIIAGNGEMKGVAPDAELYGYRALGPGGMGTSVQVIAAIEKAVKDGMDIINMSLGNSVNGPDWPTSVAVNRAVELGVSMVIANGNSGPANWTVGSPATATNAISVGASTPPLKVPYLYESFYDKKIMLTPLMGSPAWDLEKDYPVVDGGLGKEKLANVRDKIVLFERGEIPFAEKARLAEQAGARAALIYNNENGLLQGSVEDGQGQLTIPVASVTKQAGEWLSENVVATSVWMETKYEKTKDLMADFSSRGPVTANWHIKPEIVAPGAAIMSTVPDGYQELQGTSMAAPHVAGALALIKEAHPNWTPAQLKGALMTTALPLKKGEKLYEPIEQGMGRIQPEKAVETKTIIHNPMISFGKVEELQAKQTYQLTIENVSNRERSYQFEIPNQQRGLRWHVPTSFTIGPKEKKTVPITLSVTSSQVDKGLQQGWLVLRQEDESYQLPYLFLNQEGDYPKAMGIEFSLKTFSDDEYQYRMYLPEGASEITVDLYDPVSLMFDRTLLRLENQEQGIIEGTIEKRKLGAGGQYLANITITTEDGKMHSYPTEIIIEQ